MQIDFPLDGPNPKPTFTTLSSFSIPGQVMNVFLLDPIQKLFAAFIFLQGPTAIGLYCLPNWDNPEYIFIDTCIQCVSPLSSDRSAVAHTHTVLPIKLVVHRGGGSDYCPLRRQGWDRTAFLPNEPPEATHTVAAVLANCLCSRPSHSYRDQTLLFP